MEEEEEHTSFYVFLKIIGGGRSRGIFSERSPSHFGTSVKFHSPPPFSFLPPLLLWNEINRGMRFSFKEEVLRILIGSQEKGLEKEFRVLPGL